MEVLNISQDSLEEDTSGDEVENDEEEGSLGNLEEEIRRNPALKVMLRWQRRKGLEILEQLIPHNKQFSLFKFYLLDCDSSSSTEDNPLGHCSLPFSVQRYQLKPVIRLYGIDKFGSSVCCFVNGFLPYFYAAPSNPFVESDIAGFKQCLNQAVIDFIDRDVRSSSFWSYVNQDHPPIIDVELVNTHSKEKIFDYHPPSATCEAPVLKITCLLSKIVWIAADLIKKNVVTYPFTDVPCSYKLYEEQLNPTLRFLTSLNISLCSWVHVNLIPGKWNDRDAQYDLALQRQSHCQIELDIDYDCLLENLPTSSQRHDTSMPKFRIASFDIECMTRPPDYKFPRGGSDRVLQIATELSDFDPERNKEDILGKMVFTLGSCDPIENALVLSFESEESMLDAFRLFICITDPDIITGYNINKFDIPFLLDRARVVASKKLSFMGRIIRNSASCRSISQEVKRQNPHADTVPKIQGRIVFDMFPVIRHTFPYQQSFKLGHVAKNLLENSYKDDVAYTDIFILQNRSPTTRNKLARYCLQDAVLARQLMFLTPGEYPNFVSYFCEKSRCSGSPLRYLVTKSESYVEYVKTVRKQKNPQHIFPVFTPATRRKRDIADGPDNQQHRGAKVRRALFTGSAETTVE